MKTAKIILITVFFTLLFSTAALANSDINVTIDGARVAFTDQRPASIGGRTLVPVRGVFEHLGLRVRAILNSIGYRVSWDSGAQTVVVTTTLVPEPAPPQSRMGQWDEIIVIGDAVFTRRTQAALDLVRLHTPDKYEWMTHYMGIVRQYSFSGMWYWLDPPEFRVGTATYMASALWYASTIIHDALHSRQAYYDPRTFRDIYSRLWHDAEMEALYYQYVFFKRAGAPQRYRDHIIYLQDNPWWLDGQVTW